MVSESDARLGRSTRDQSKANGKAKGMVERFHRHLKSALLARLTGPNWIDELPWAWVLLGIRTAPKVKDKEDFECSSAELVYGAPLTVPGDFLQESQEAGQFLPRLRETVRELAPRPAIPSGSEPVTAPADRRQCRAAGYSRNQRILVYPTRLSPPACRLSHLRMRGHTTSWLMGISH